MPEASPSDLERMKWESEKSFRERELLLKERAQDNSDAALALQRSQQSQFSWNSPLVGAVLAAAVAGAANAFVAYWNGASQINSESVRAENEIKNENVRAGNQIKSDAMHAESERILEMIKTGDPVKARANLEFLAKSGLISTPQVLSNINKYIKENPLGGPVLPTSNGSYSKSMLVLDKSPNIPKEVRNSIETSVGVFSDYLKKTGTPAPKEKIHASAQDDLLSTKHMYSDFDPSTHTINIDSSVVDDVDAPLHEYVQYVITSAPSSIDSRDPGMYVLQNDLADYFVCSFRNRPGFSAVMARASQIGRPFMRELNKKVTFDPKLGGSLEDPAEAAVEGKEVAGMDYAREAVAEGREMWGSVFWQIRSAIGRNEADRIIAASLLAIPEIRWDRGETISPIFVYLIIENTKRISPKNVSRVAEIFKTAGFPAPKPGSID